MSYYSTYRWCAVAECKNTSVKTPDKLWIQVPNDINMREIWFKVGKRDPELLSKKSRLYFCEDHFDLEHDMEDYIKYKIMGSVKRIRLKPYCIPSKFKWNRKHKAISNELHLTASERLRTISKDSVRDHVEENKEDQTRDAITSPGVSQCDKALVVESEASQTSTNSPEDMIECTYSSSTESALSDADDPSTFTTYEEQRRLMNDENQKPRSDQAATETTASIQHSEVNRIGELELGEEVQPEANKPNTQTSNEKKKREEIIERYKVIQCYTIIANVYHYLNEEYESLKRQLGAVYDVSSLSDILARTAAAAGVSQQTVTRALNEHRIKAAIRADHCYNKGISRSSKPRSKSKMAGFGVRMRKKDGTHSHTLKKKQENKGNDGETVRPSKKRTTKSSIRSKPRDVEQLLSKTRQSKVSVPSRKRQTNNNEEHDGDSMGPPKRRSTRISVRSKPSDEEQLPFPSPIQLRVHGVMETEYKTEPADDERPPTLGDDPLESGSWSHHHCEQASTTEETETLFKAEPADDDCLQDFKPDPLKLESNAALEEPSESPDMTQVKFECVDEDMDMSKDYLICDPTPLDIKPEPQE